MNEIPAKIVWTVGDDGKVAALVEWTEVSVSSSGYRPPDLITKAMVLSGFRPPRTV